MKPLPAYCREAAIRNKNVFPASGGECMTNPTLEAIKNKHIFPASGGEYMTKPTLEAIKNKHTFPASGGECMTKPTLEEIKAKNENTFPASGGEYMTKPTLEAIRAKRARFVIGLMSGTSVDGVDAALVKIEGFGEDIAVTPLAYIEEPFDEDVKNRIFSLFEDSASSAGDICHMNFLLGEIFASAAASVVRAAGMRMDQIDLIGSHGQTIHHAPDPRPDTGYLIRSTLQIGEAAVIAHRCGAVTVSDFRVMDMAAGGQGAPLVPYTEYLLYRSRDQCVALLNIGGIGNITVLPPCCRKCDVVAFDTGPGNMVIDYLVKRATNGAMAYDKDGQTGARGKIYQPLLQSLISDSYFDKKPPKSTGREHFGDAFSERFFRACVDASLPFEDMVATATAFTARCVALSLERHVKRPIDKLIVGGGGSCNKTLLRMLAMDLRGVEILTQEDLGFNGKAKEAIAFAILANEAIFQNTGNLPSATGASQPKVLGKISFS